MEIDRVLLTHKLAQIKEDEGDLTGAASIICELQGEDYDTPKTLEGVELILEQFRLCLVQQMESISDEASK